MALYAFDGTWNEADERRLDGPRRSGRWRTEVHANRDSRETNVRRISRAYEHAGDGRAFYVAGVGTTPDDAAEVDDRTVGEGSRNENDVRPPSAPTFRIRFKLLVKGVGGGTGAGAKRRIRKMYDDLIQQYPHDPVIDVAGFSRGSAMAVHFCNVIDRRGIPSPEAKRPRVPHWSRYVGWHRLPKRVDASDDVRVRFLGIFDMVPSFGVPLSFLRNRSPTWRFRTIPDRVETAFHAMALDEVRATFSLVRPNYVGDAEAADDRLYSLWFRGVHSNVGGGYDDRGLSDITLAWMLEMFLLVVGSGTPTGIRKLLESLQPDFAAIERIDLHLDPIRPNPDGLLGRPYGFLKRNPRKIESEPLIHHSALARRDLPTDYEDGKSLLVPIPQDRLVVYDPPMLRAPGKRQRALTIALETFHRVPFNPERWLRAGDDFVFRSDHWIACGPFGARRDSPARTWQIPRQAAVAIIATWLLDGRPELLDPTTIPWPVRSYVPRAEYADMPEMLPPERDEACAAILAVVRGLDDHGQGPAELDGPRRHHPTPIEVTASPAIPRPSRVRPA